MSGLAGLAPSVVNGVGAALGAGLVAFGWLVVRRLGQMVKLLGRVAGMVPQIDDHERRLTVLEGALALTVTRPPKESS